MCMKFSVIKVCIKKLDRCTLSIIIMIIIIFGRAMFSTQIIDDMKVKKVKNLLYVLYT